MLRASERALKYCGAVGGCFAVAICCFYLTRSDAQSLKESPAGGPVANSNTPAHRLPGVVVIAVARVTFSLGDCVAETRQPWLYFRRPASSTTVDRPGVKCPKNKECRKVTHTAESA